MKKIITILTIFFISTTVRAEYNGYHIKFEIKTAKGKTKVGFAYLTSDYLNTDSLKNTTYLKKALDQSSKQWEKRDSLVYFKERIKYEYRPASNNLNEKTTIYSLDNKQAILHKEIHSINIIEIIDYTYLKRISSPLSISDTTWTNKEPLSSYSFGGYLCYHQIYMHKNSKKVDKIIKQLQAKQNELKDTEINSNNGHEIDKAFREIIKDLYGEKVVIITECSC